MKDIAGYAGFALVILAFTFGFNKCEIDNKRIEYCKEFSKTSKEFSNCIGKEHVWDVNK